MQNKFNQQISTCDPLSGVKFQPAQGFNMHVNGSTAPAIAQVRTVVTTAQTGSLDLRYAPRNAIVLDKKTSY